MEATYGMVAYGILGFFFVILLIGYINRDNKYPVLDVLNRWVRWVTFSIAVGLILTQWELFNRPLWVLAIICFLIWFLIESAYNWFLIRMLSFSEIPLFPRFFKDVKEPRWPISVQFFKIREWLHARGFRPVQVLRSHLADSLDVQCHVFQDLDKRVRLQIIYIPALNVDRNVNFIFSSITASDHRIITDNLSVPYGGYYPGDWDICRKPMIRTLEKLHQAHLKRIQTNEEEVLITWEQDPMEEMNYQQSTLEKYNFQQGFLQPKSDYEEKGRITHEGCYRIWKEMWFLKYLGMFIYRSR
jgi:hypothetical protein